MDLLYLPDSISYQSRIYSHNLENQSWVNINAANSVKQQKRERKECSKDQRTCSICKSRQKRVLSTYIMKTRRDSDKDTFIEEDEEDEEMQKDVEKCAKNEGNKSE